ncbi:hypothetical protein [Niallia sp. FSL R7-0271]|uniref:hypothetical protein n=1 Tax=Niallia sp. FSL R7-0271 TaxID=2921678 RepID=UPI0030FBEB09
MGSVPAWLYVMLVFFSGLVGVVTTIITTAIRQSKRDRYEVYVDFMQHRGDGWKRVLKHSEQGFCCI